MYNRFYDYRLEHQMEQNSLQNDRQLEAKIHICISLVFALKQFRKIVQIQT